ncbi:glycosyltransferase [Bacillus sp. AK128]
MEESFSRYFDDFLLSKYNNRSNYIFSLGKGIFDEDILKLINDFDIVHLHWINNYLLSIEILSKISKPIIWTMRDMWPFTGGCHYSIGCMKFMNGCGKCDFLQSKEIEDVSKWVITRKKLSYSENIYPVAISNWLKDYAEKSYLFSNFEISMIPNCIDNRNVFIPQDKQLSKEALGIPLDKKVLLFGAVNSSSDERKGFKYLEESIKNINNPEDFFLIIFGSDEEEKFDFSVDYKNVGRVNNDLLLAKVYSASDVFIAPSIEEAFGKTILEAMSSGTPVIAFNATGPKDLIIHKQTGYLAEPYKAEDLLEGINYILEDKEKALMMGVASRKRVEQRFDSILIATSYKNLYEKVIQEKKVKARPLEDKNILDKLTKDKIDPFSRYLKSRMDEGFFYPFHKDERTEKLKRIQISIFGAGEYGQKIKTILQAKGFKIASFYDNDKSKLNVKVDDIPIKAIDDYRGEFIIIASLWYKEIAEQLEEKGLEIVEDYLIGIL